MSVDGYEIAVFGANEAAKIGACLSAINQACEGTSSHIAVILNGTADNSLDIIKKLHLSNCSLSIYFIVVADKANAINQFIYHLRKDAALSFFVDAYVRIGRHSLSAMADALNANPHAVAASGVPLTGRSARMTAENTMKGGALNGQFYALRREFLDRMVSANIKIPLRLYRGDGLLGSLAAHNLDALGNGWDNGRIIGVGDATFEISPLSPFKPADLKRQFRREIRQARGRFENEGIKSIIYTEGYAALPESADEMITTWAKSNNLPIRSLKDHLFIRLARAQPAARKIAPDQLVPKLVFESS